MTEQTGPHAHTKEFKDKLDKDMGVLMSRIETMATEGHVSTKYHPALDAFMSLVHNQTQQENMEDVIKGMAGDKDAMDRALEGNQLSMQYVFWLGYVLGQEGYHLHSCEEDHGRQVPSAN